MNKSNMYPGSVPADDSRSLSNDDERIRQSAESNDSKIYACKKLAPFFQVEITLKIFGQVIWHCVFPPDK